MKIEVSIFLGLNCNFNCSHCLNHSRPGLKDYDITKKEMNKIVSQIMNNKLVTAVSFTGGEPLLYIDEIQNIVEELRTNISDRVIHFSITTNGSLIPQTAEKLKRIKLDSVLISYDIPHSSFSSTDEISCSLSLAKMLFDNVEIATTFENIASEPPILEVATLHNVKVNFNRTIQSGRFKRSSEDRNLSKLENIVCPNLESSTSERLKLIYFPSHGFSFCCGPLLFDNLNNSAEICFDSIEALIQSQRYQLQKKLAATNIKCSFKTNCENCYSTMSNPVFKKNSTFFLNTNLWDNTVPFSAISTSELTSADDFFRLRRIGFSTLESFKNIPDTALSPIATLTTDYGNKLTPHEHNEISSFIIDSFYRVHSSFFTEKDVETFLQQLPVFFSLPFHFIRHKLDGKIVGILLVAVIDNHPYYKKSVWHIGYWGIDSCVKDRATRECIKNEWQKLLKTLSSQHQISVIIEDFNTPAWKMAESFGMDLSTLRLDPRTT